MNMFHKVPLSRRSRRRELVARLRGEHTLHRMRRAGLHAPGPVSIASRVYIDEAFAWAITIGAHSRIASDVRIIAHDAAAKHVTGYTEVRPVVIGANCYLGTGVIVLPGTTVGDGSVIGAGAVISDDIPAGVVAVGVPARAVSGVSDLRRRHLETQDQSTLFDKRPVDCMSASEWAAVRDALARDGHVYVR
jgi:serine acetyltransferase